MDRPTGHEHDEDLLTPRESVRLLGITARTLDRYVATGKVEALKLPSGHKRFRRGDLLALLERAW